MSDLKAKTNRSIARHASVEIKAFMPLASAPDKFDSLFCKWGLVTRTVWLDDCGGKRTIDEDDLDYMATEAISTRPKENPRPEDLSAMRFPDWVENAIREEKRQEAAINQYFKIEEAELRNWNKADDDGAVWGNFADDEEEVAAWGRRYATNEDDAEFCKLLEANEDIEV